MVKQPDKKKDDAAPASPLVLAKMRARIAWDGELAIGNAIYQVKAGAVEVPPWHVAQAQAAGFQIDKE